MPNRHTIQTSSDYDANGNRVYRYGFNGKESDFEAKNITGAQYDYGFRIYDPRLGKFLSLDPLSSSYPWYTPYQFAGNKPIWAIDLDGLEELTGPINYEPMVVHEPDDSPVETVTKMTGGIAISIYNNSAYLFNAIDGLTKKKPGKALNYIATDAKNMAIGMGDAIYDMATNPAATIYGLVTDPNKLQSALNGIVQGKVVYGKGGVKTKSQIKKVDVTYTAAQISAARRAAVSKAWKAEKTLVEKTGKGTRAWTKAEKKQLKDNGKVEGYAGHHINDVKNYPGLAGDPNNIEFLKTGNPKGGGAKKGTEHYLKHNTPDGKKIESSSGPLLDRTVKL